MARPVKKRRVCDLPACRRFGPLDAGGQARRFLNMTVDEYETIRLIDLEGLTQEECAGQMAVARTTVQGIYADARKKLAALLVDGVGLEIGGGAYQLCEDVAKGCGRNCRRRNRRHRRFAGGKGEVSL